MTTAGLLLDVWLAPGWPLDQDSRPSRSWNKQAQIAAVDGLSGGFQDTGEATAFGCVLPVESAHEGDIRIEENARDVASRCSRLHTWGSAMTHPPHVRMIVPGGGIALVGSGWISSRPAILLPVRALCKLRRRLFLTELVALHDASHCVLCPAAPCSRPRGVMGRLRQGAVRRTGGGARLPRATPTGWGSRTAA